MKRSVVSPDGRDSSIDMQGAEFRIIAVNDAESYEMFFYPRSGKSSAGAKVDALVRDIKNDLGKVTGVAFPVSGKRPSYR